MQDPVYRIVHIVAQSKRKICTVANEIEKVANNLLKYDCLSWISLKQYKISYAAALPGLLFF